MISFAAMPLLAKTGDERTDSLLPLASIFFVWLFVFDTVVTFIRRGLRREKVWRAHREHLYQRIVQSGRSHATVSTIYGVLALLITISTAYAFVSYETVGCSAYRCRNCDGDFGVGLFFKQDVARERREKIQ